jgi:hypothetical protein
MRHILRIIVFAFACAIQIPTLHAQDRLMMRVIETLGTEENPISTNLGRLEIGDHVDIEFIRLSGDLIPIIALVNESNGDRIVFRYRDRDQDGKLDETSYELNDEAGLGNYKMQIATDPEIDRLTSGDFIIVYTIRRGSQILNKVTRPIPESYDAPIILINAPSTDEVLTLYGDINDETFRVDFLIELNNNQPMQFIVTRDSGDLIPLIGFTPTEDEDFVTEEAANNEVSMTYPLANAPHSDSGTFIIAITRQNVDEGTTTGIFKLEISPVVAEG